MGQAEQMPELRHASETLADGCVVEIREQQVVQLADILIEDGPVGFRLIR